jgi:hypothetical protein
MFVDVILVHMMEMAVVKIVDMAVMANRCVPAVRAMLMGRLEWRSSVQMVMTFLPLSTTRPGQSVIVSLQRVPSRPIIPLIDKIIFQEDVQLRPRPVIGYWCTRRSNIGPGSGGIMRLCGGVNAGHFLGNSRGSRPDGGRGEKNSDSGLVLRRNRVKPSFVYTT